MIALKEAPAEPRGGRIRFFATFVALSGAFYLAEAWGPSDIVFFRYLEANAHVANALLRLLAQDTHVQGLDVLSPSFGISIRKGCDGLEPAWIFASAVIAFPSRLRRKAIMIALGVPLILAANLGRIVSLFFIGARIPAAYAVAHLELWPAAFFVFLIVLWWRWVREPVPSKRYTR